MPEIKNWDLVHGENKAGFKRVNVFLTLIVNTAQMNKTKQSTFRSRVTEQRMCHW